ncbi:unnamed protein product [Peniophora sp. CBMAI 1063]|nr:unnamed protein product [Peniophora sp. CBMAI 1063]
MDVSTFVQTGIHSGLLTGWLVGPVYGANFAMAVVIVRKLWPHRRHAISRSLMLIATLIIITCTVHAFISLDDLIVGFTLTQGVDTEGPAVIANYFLSVRFNNTACISIYVINSSCNNLFVVWRVYMTWGRNLKLSVLLIFLHLVALALGIACVVHIERTGSLLDKTITALLTSGWAFSMLMQVSGALLIGWRTIGTPQSAINRQSSGFYLAIWHALIESGSLALVTELVGLVFLYRNLGDGIIVIITLGQITALSSLAIILREIYKAEVQSSMGFVNITSPIAMQMSSLSMSRNQGRSPLSAAEHGAVPDNAVVVNIETVGHGAEEDLSKIAKTLYR